VLDTGVYIMLHTGVIVIFFFLEVLQFVGSSLLTSLYECCNVISCYLGDFKPGNNSSLPLGQTVRGQARINFMMTV